MKILEAENDIKGGTAGPIDLDSGLKSVVVKYRLDFDNSEYVMNSEIRRESQKILIAEFFSLIINYMCCLHQINEPNHHFTITKHKTMQSLDGEAISHSSPSVTIELEAGND